MKKNVQVLLSEDETAVLTQAAAVSGISDMRGFISVRMRALALAWAHDVVGTRGLVRGGTCADCAGDQPATWTILGIRKFVCAACAARRNSAVPDSCVEGVGMDRVYLPAAEYEAKWERVIAAECERRAVGKRSELVAEMLRAAAAVIDYDRNGGEEKTKTDNSDVTGLFKSS